MGHGKNERKRGRVSAAFTLLELVIVVAVLGTLAAVAVPRYADFLAEQRVAAAARRLVADLALAQRTAKMAGAPQTVTFNVAADRYTLVGMPDPDRANTEYTVVLSADPYGAKITAISLGGDNALVFDGYGVPDSSASVFVRVGERAKSVSLDADSGHASIGSGSTVLLPPEPVELPPV